MNPINHPLLVFVFSFAALTFSAWFGSFLRLRRAQEGDARKYGVVESATLTLLALIVRFTFSMAIDRYNQRKQCEAVEANTIGAEYLRLSLLCAADASTLRVLMQEYADLRIAFYVTRDRSELALINATTTQVQSRLWSTFSTAAGALLSISFFLITDSDSPRWGLIHVRPANFDALAVSLHASP